MVRRRARNRKSEKRPSLGDAYRRMHTSPPHIRWSQDCRAYQSILANGLRLHQAMEKVRLESLTWKLDYKELDQEARVDLGRLEHGAGADHL